MRYQGLHVIVEFMICNWIVSAVLIHTRIDKHGECSEWKGALACKSVIA